MYRDNAKENGSYYLGFRVLGFRALRCLGVSVQDALWLARLGGLSYKEVAQN